MFARALARPSARPSVRPPARECQSQIGLASKPVRQPASQLGGQLGGQRARRTRSDRQIEWVIYYGTPAAAVASGSQADGQTHRGRRQTAGGSPPIRSIRVRRSRCRPTRGRRQLGRRHTNTPGWLADRDNETTRLFCWRARLNSAGISARTLSC